LDESRAYGPDGALWTHQVAVIVPKNLRLKNVSFIYVTGGCNENPKPPKIIDGEFMLMDEIAWNVGQITVYVNQIPNCHIIYPSDPSKKRRSEDAMIAWAWNEYLITKDPNWLPRFPMAKAGFQCMRAAEEFTRKKGIADIKGWLVSGASKRGWTTWMIGAATCPTCPTILGLVPIVPIVPSLNQSMHRQWRSYDGWTFAFKDYTDVNLTTKLDSPGFNSMCEIIDPIFYYDRLARLPKLVVVSSDDEFMQMDWTEFWYPNMKGETHLLIA